MNGSSLLYEARRRAGLTQADLASRVGTTQSAIARIERGRTSPSFDRLTRLIGACGFELQVRLVPLDDHDLSLAEDLMRLEPSARLERMLRTAALRGAARSEGKTASGA
jgi:transcriptional regulator with XRE-family HTH domain